MRLDVDQGSDWGEADARVMVSEEATARMRSRQAASSVLSRARVPARGDAIL